MFKGEFVFPRRFAERIAFGKELPGFPIRRTPKELGVVDFKYGMRKFKDAMGERSHGVMGEQPKEAVFSEDLKKCIMQADIRKVRISLLSHVITHLVKYRRLKKEGYNPPLHVDYDGDDPLDYDSAHAYEVGQSIYEEDLKASEQEARILFSLGTMTGVLSSRDKVFIHSILRTIERSEWWRSKSEFEIRERMDAFLREQEGVIQVKPPATYEQAVQKIRELKRRKRKAVVGVFLGSIRPPTDAHTAFIQYLRQFCDSLIVMVGSDELVNWMRLHRDSSKKNRVTAKTSTELLHSMPCLDGKYDFAVIRKADRYNNAELERHLKELRADFVQAPKVLTSTVRAAGARLFPLERDLGLHSSDLEALIEREYRQAYNRAVSSEPKLTESRLVKLDLKLNFPWNFD